MAEKGIAFEYFNPKTIKNSAEKINKTIGVITPPNGKGFGVESALTNLEQVDTTITQSGTAVKVHTLGLTLPTEQSVEDAILDSKDELLDDITQLDETKLNKNLGSINSGKILSVDSNGNVYPTSAQEMGGLLSVSHDESMAGAGTDSDPLRVSPTILEDITTSKNNISDLGDQVQGIEEKIPGQASSTNQLADKDFVSDGLAQKQDLATALNYDDISNCILEIPQDIKLELNNGTLTLKAGSKVYVPNGFTDAEETVQYYCWGPTRGNYVYTKSATPSVGDMMYFNQNGTMVETSGQIAAGNITNTDGTSIGNDNGYTYPRYAAGDTQVTTAAGTPKFDEITIESDISQSATGSGSYALFYRPDNQDVPFLYNSSLYSGTTNPAQTYCAWYDTSNNIVKIFTDSATVPAYTTSLPIAIFQVSNGQIASIDQVFNGFGYIGYTVFALPGVKGLIPNGRNIDGTLSNTVFTVNSVKTIGYAASYNDYTVSLSASSIDIWVADRLVYNEQKNHNINTQDNSVQTVTICGKVSCDGTRIKYFELKTAFRALDYNNTEYIAHQSVPTNRYIDFTVGAHGTYYTAPADGWFVIISTNSQVADLSIGLRNESNELMNQTYIANTNAIYAASIGVAKGQRIQGYYYGQDISTLTIRFVYAKGAK